MNPILNKLLWAGVVVLGTVALGAAESETRVSIERRPS